jgi:hypothetical protein
VGTTVADCATLNYGPGFITSYTTATTTGVYFNPSQGGDPVVFSKTGENFDCSQWSSENSAGRLVTPISAFNGLVGHVVTILSLSGRVSTPPTPEPTATATPPVSGTPLGDRIFSISRPGSLLRSSSAPDDLSTDPWLSGPVVLHAGPVDGSGIAALSLQSDVTYGFGLAAGGVMCVRIQAAGSGGTIDCNGGSPHTVLLTQDSNGAGVADAPILTLHVGPDSGAGAASLTVMQSITNLASGTPSDCIAAVFGPPELTAYTSSTITATIAEPVQGGNLTFTTTGENFSCSTWTVENGPGTLAAPRIIVDGGGNDEAQGLVISD